MRLATSAAMAALILVGCGSDSDDDAESPPEPASGAAESVAANATYTGEACDYDGPDELAVGTTLAVTAVNTTSEPQIGFALWKVPDGTTAEEIAEAGIFEVVSEDDEAHDVVFAPTEQDTEYALAAVLDVAGTWAVNCFFLAAGGDIEYPTVFTATDG